MTQQGQLGEGDSVTYIGIEGISAEEAASVHKVAIKIAGGLIGARCIGIGHKHLHPRHSDGCRVKKDCSVVLLEVAFGGCRTCFARPAMLLAWMTS